MTCVFKASMRCAALSAVLVACVPTLAFAQQPAGNVAVTYTFLRDTEADQSFASGVTVSGTLRVHRWLALTGEAAVSADSKDYAATAGGNFDFRYESIQAGPSVARTTGALRPYVQLLAGATRWRIRYLLLNPTGWESVTNFSLQPGVGVDVFFARRVALRVGADVRILFRHDSRFDQDYRTNLYRFHAGVSVHFGGR